MREFLRWLTSWHYIYQRPLYDDPLLPQRDTARRVIAHQMFMAERRSALD